MEERLVTVRTYAEMYRVTTECVRKWIRQNKVNWKVIDGVNFVVLTDEEMKQRDILRNKINENPCLFCEFLKECNRKIKGKEKCDEYIGLNL